ncbi:MAG: hypothetical protein VYA55_22050 [Pseudomonadota bacterium]|nr:hypothetical protein [Pseudomonadota bacterium]
MYSTAIRIFMGASILKIMKYISRFTSELKASTPEVWEWMTSFEGISKEMSPLMVMTAPAHVKSLESVAFEPGKPIFRSWLLLFKVLPFDYSDFTLERVDVGTGFVEQSSMGSMRLWRHVRNIQSIEGGCMLTDELTYEPRFAGVIAHQFVKMLFKHRHRQLRKHMGELPQ